MKLSTLLLCYKGNLGHWAKDHGHATQADRDETARYLRGLRRTCHSGARAERIGMAASLFYQARMVHHRDGRVSISTPPK